MLSGPWQSKNAASCGEEYSRDRAWNRNDHGGKVGRIGTDDDKRGGRKSEEGPQTAGQYLQPTCTRPYTMGCTEGEDQKRRATLKGTRGRRLGGRNMAEAGETQRKL